MVKIRKRTKELVTENSEKVIVDLFGNRCEIVCGSNDGDVISEDYIYKGDMTDEPKRMKLGIELIKHNDRKINGSCILQYGMLTGKNMSCPVKGMKEFKILGT